MTYRGETKGLGVGKLPEGIKEVYARNQNYAEYQRRQAEKRDREKLFKQNAPKNPVRRFFYNMEKRKLERKRGGE